MSRQVSLDETAINQATAFLADDPDGLHAVLAAIDALGEHPYPENALPFGSTGLQRLRVGRYRELYTVSDDLVSAGHIARTPLTADPPEPPKGLSWNQTWCELPRTRARGAVRA